MAKKPSTTPPKQSLLEQAKAQPHARRGNGSQWTTPEYVALGIAWLKGEIEIAQIAKALQADSKSSSNIRIGLSSALRQAYATGQIKVED